MAANVYRRETTRLIYLHLVTDTYYRAPLKVRAEFHRITNVNLRNQFYSEPDRHTPHLMTLFLQKAACTGRTSDALRDMKAYDCQVAESDEPDVSNTCRSCNRGFRQHCSVQSREFSNG